MKHYIIATMIISTAVFWGIILTALICGYIIKKRDTRQDSYEKSDLHGTLCFIFNLLGGFLLFELFSLTIAVFTGSAVFNIILHFPAWYVAMWTAERIFPHIVNPLVGIFVGDDE
ncbi:MAG: hypothetical protein NC340_03845 [Ruminococcus flavefaciens]|nr:hypothetical protein [Ruminococcus flavefaciens]MCM1229183.1 hypothetical protein [Ruminococcus flavefaciens]